MAPDPYRYFRPEARDIVDQFSKGVLDLEKGGSAVVVQRLLRLAHTLKGAARVVKQGEIASCAHAIEDALSPYRDRADGFAREQIDAILGHLDEISSRLGTLSPTGGSEPSAPKPTPEDAPRTVRTDIAETDVVLDAVAEAHALLNGLRGATRGVEEARDLADIIAAQIASRASNGRGADTNIAPLFALADELRRKLGSAGRNLGSTADRMDAELRQLREVAERLRLVPAASMFIALERTARDAARRLGKEAILEAKGGDVRLDGHVIETVQDALIQIVRNAVAHGIEPPGARRAAGKPAAGRIVVNVFRRGRRVVFACRDDGCGVDLDAVRRVATERGFAGPGAKHRSADDLMRMLLRGGISTSKTVTDVSGRGVGLDVVRAATERLGGELVFRSEPGKGTTFEIVIPPLLAAVEAIIVEAGGAAYAMPTDAVRCTRRLTALSATASGACFLHEESALPFIPLTTALDGARRSAAGSAAAVIVIGSGALAAIGVDRIVGTARIMVRPLPQRLLASPIVAGASLDADSNPQLVLDPDRLVAVAQGGFAVEPDAAVERRPILVVDDSLTTRMLESSILESAGYDVDVATSGEEALERVRGKRYGVILVDVEMPGMDGFTFIERLRSDSALRDIPAFLVTSRASPQDRERGRKVGAKGHICKSEFDQAALLAMIAPLMG
jgi:two-component system chemotaxis sensor kinase CheA